MRYKSLLLAVLMGTMAQATGRLQQFEKVDLNNAVLHFSKSSVVGNVEGSLKYDNDGFYVQKHEEIKRIHSYDTDKLLCNRNKHDIIRFGVQNKFKLKQFDNGDYKLEAAGGLKGGGATGAVVGSTAGIMVTNIACYGTLWAISWLAGPLHTPVFLGLSKACAPVITSASYVVGTATGAIGAVATGPV